MSNIMSNVDWFGMFSGMMGSMSYWFGVIFISLFLIALLWIGYYYITFNYTLTIFPMCGSGKDGVFGLGKPRKNRIKWNKGRKAWIKMFPLMNKKEEEPFPPEYIYPGNRIYAFELNGELIPGQIQILQSGEEIKAQIKPVPHYLRNWQSLQHKKNELEFAEHDWWSDNKALIITVIICGLNLAVCGFTIWFTYKYAMGGRADIQTMTEAIRNLGVAKGIAPG